MQLDLVVMVRNEADIWGEFLAHVCPLFDRIAVIDHQSTDGTSDITQDFIRQGAALEVYRYAHRARIQSELSNAFARRSFENGADWVFFLDADEFLEIPDRISLEEHLRASRTGLVSFSWKNLVPTVFGNFESFDLTQEFTWTGACSSFCKVGLSRTFVSRFPYFRIHNGNHAVSVGDLAPADNIGAILHIPIRSAERLRYKLAWGVATDKARRARRPWENFHQHQLLGRMESGPVDVETLNGFAARYSQPIDEALPVDPIAANWPRLRIAKVQTFLALSQKGVCREETERRDLTLAWDNQRILLPSAISVSITNGNVKIRLRPSWRSVKNAIFRRINKAARPK